tara:strand:- start:23376 stop:23513 length:138 start_codon:yes stop_codon:yes gene_type:complete
MSAEAKTILVDASATNVTQMTRYENEPNRKGSHMTRIGETAAPER